MKKVFKWIGIVLVAALLIIQLVPRPEKNESILWGEEDIRNKFPMPVAVGNIMKESCMDCHSNNTRYPWYASVQPVALWLGEHIENGKKHLDFSSFAGYSPRKQFHKLEEVEEMISEGEMPLESYTVIHRKANLTDEQKKTMIEWSKALRDSMRNWYPADSLVKKKG